MDQEIRNKLRNVVTQCRKLLEDSVSQELEGKYGIFAKKDQVTADPNAKMHHLSEEEQAARKDILDHFGHIEARGFRPKDALDQLVREIAFTHLNRLCAYKMMEAREVYVGGQKFREAVSRGFNSNGVKFYLADHPEDERLFNTGHQDIAYRHFLDWLGGLLSDEIGVLFNPNDPANRLHPRQKTLDEVLDLLNGGGIKPEETELREEWPKIWSQDETIGWVYQYFTPKELRDQARKESQAPRNSYELAFRNQFFTPRYVVEFLTDNTLGRIWYEMRKGDTKLKDSCRYLVRRPTEIFVSEGEQPPKDAAGERDDLSQEELLKLPVHIPHRPKKDPRELKILDPACGSGHFLLYCFDLLLTIYEEAYGDPELGPALQNEKDYPTLEALQRDVPRLILVHNVHGIDIDLRCSQIAALALWLRCQRAFQEMGLRKDRPKITRSNFVCAEPMPGEEQMLKEFVGQVEPKFLGQVVEVVFDKMKLAGEAGSLLKIEEDIRDAVSNAKEQWVREMSRAKDRKGQSLLFTQAEIDRIHQKPEQTSLFDVSDITNEQFFERAEGEVIKALRQYAEATQNGDGLQRKLFAEDAVRGFGFVEICHKRFDVVLMNPPFGASSCGAKPWIDTEYPSSRFDLGACFIDCMLGRTHDQGFVGVIANRTIWFLHRCTPFRQRLLREAQIHTGTDLGLGVLDAFVETGLLTIEHRVPEGLSEWYRLNDTEDRAECLTAIVQDRSNQTERIFLRSHAEIDALPNTSFSYWLPHDLTVALGRVPSLSELNYEAKQGLATKDNERFLRLRWEVPHVEIDRRWRTYAKGGAYSPIIADFSLLIDWGSDAAVAYADRDGQFCCLISGRSDHYSFRPGITYSERTSRFSARIFPAGGLFDTKGPLVFSPTIFRSTDSPDDLLSLCLVMNSGLAQFLFDASAGASDEGKGRDYSQGMIGRLPLPEHFRVSNQLLSEANAVIREYVSLASEDPSSSFFYSPSLSVTLREMLSLRRKSLRQFNEHVRQVTERASWEYGEALELSKDTVAKILDEVTASHRTAEHEICTEHSDTSYVSAIFQVLLGVIWGIADVRLCNTERPVDGSWSPIAELPRWSPGTLLGRDGLPTSEEGDVGKDYPVNIDWLGILVDDPEHTHDVVRRVRNIWEVIWKDDSATIEKEACEMLRVNELRDYFRKGNSGFWADHIARYSKSRRNAPIYWLLQSSKKNYALWLYYHRLNKDILFKALVNYVEPKIRLETDRLKSLHGEKAKVGDSSKEAKRLAKDLEEQEDFLSELRDFEDKLRRAANLHLEPDLNDGVVLNIAPLHELVPWKEAQNYWDELLEGKYEWSSISKQLRQKGLVK